jgi:hypothetical protein
MPDAVFDAWIAPEIPHYGWPFTKNQKSPQGTRWKDFFGGYELDFWGSCEWGLKNLELTPFTFDPDSVDRAQWIVDFVTKGIQTRTANLVNTKQRFWACASYLREHRRIPLPVIGLLGASSIHLFDGHHRLASLIHLGAAGGSFIPAWIAVPA